MDGLEGRIMKLAPQTIVAFWVHEVGAERWFAGDKTLDAAIARRFHGAWDKARRGELKAWETSVDGALALLLLLDQFPRNMFRGTAQAFSTDAKARAVAERALARGYDLMMPAGLRAFFYLPLMHSENPDDQARCVHLIAERLGTASKNYPFALGHAEEISRFGRFPGRNAALGRKSTPAERSYLEKLRRR